ncbi:integral membrane protein, AcrB/AcrD/AcrF family [endosymbiont of Acanthamoeba sp. UWC8]|uniref:efflux RND transporter permease subunit n=1 Tax=endosymbiont of Acanthamoeba sp. UWC8 TaxID=86106 RepID=UPI0004D1CBCE|nr:efflux RND transporter permease subunit [endosymbiont of Acanthamoeba sp. UWC8]AIF81662.1 integral membrane protein, AcrB/AcrD/AcrF family [endosymbiont of Acanthamoeba sp. UWC8]
MKLPVFFIKRPVFATIINILIVIIGLLAFKNISLREYPDITTPEITIRIPYPNASAEVVESEIAFTAENELAGINGLTKIKSSSTYGEAKISLKFSEEVEFSKALSDVREKVATMRSMLPKDIKEPQIYENNDDDDPFYYISITNPNKSSEELIHFAFLNIQNNLIGIPGVADAQIWGASYSMQITLNRNKLYLYKINVSDILDKLKLYATNLPAGKINDSIPITLDISCLNEQDFSNIVIKNQGSTNITLKDIADIKLKGKEDFRIRINGKPGIMIAVKKTINSNPLKVSEQLTKKLEKIRQTLPADYAITSEYDKSDFIRFSLSNVKNSIIEAVILVVLIIFLFLRNIRAALIPLITIPICLAGCVAILDMLGFSLNTLTLLAMVLSIGLVVDDAIVILENIYKYIEAGKSPLKAAKEGSKEIGFAVVAMTFTLSSVFIPLAFMQGSIGKLFIEFAVALAGSVVISGIVALTLSPMLAAKVLKPGSHNILPKIDLIIYQIETKYQTLLSKILPKKILLSITLVLLIVGSAIIYNFIPKEMAPKEDRGIVGAFIQKLSGISLNEFDDYSIRVERASDSISEINKKVAFISKHGSQIVNVLNDWSKRKRSAKEVKEEYQEKAKLIPSVQTSVWSEDSNLPGMESDNRGEINFIVKTTLSYLELIKTLDGMVNTLKKNPLFKEATHNLELNNIGYDLRFDKYKFSQLNILPQHISDLLAVSFDDKYVQNFLKDGISYNVNLSSDYKPKNINEIYIFNNNIPVSIGGFSELKLSAKANELRHHNQMRAAKINIELKPEVNFDQAYKEINNFIHNINEPGIIIDLGEKLERFRHTYLQMLFLIALAIFFIYAVLAIQFESFIDPLIIIFTVPLGCFGALLFTKLSGNSINIFSQIGIITLIGLISKHGIMIVEFANNIVKERNASCMDAVIEASKLRLRPIMMTTFAMVFGSFPLILSFGAGAEARNAIGYVLVGGLTIGTIFTLIIIPFMYIALKALNKKNLTIT